MEGDLILPFLKYERLVLEVCSNEVVYKGRIIFFLQLSSSFFFSSFKLWFFEYIYTQ